MHHKGRRETSQTESKQATEAGRTARADRERWRQKVRSSDNRTTGSVHPDSVSAAHAQFGNQSLQQLADDGAIGRQRNQSDGASGTPSTDSDRSDDGGSSGTTSPGLRDAPAPARRKVEQSTGPLPSIRIDQGTTAQEKLAAENAIAAARGTKILAEPGAFSGTDGAANLAHEVAHVLQQSGSTTTHYGTEVAEADAEAFAQSATSGKPADVGVSTSVGWAYQSSEVKKQEPGDPVVALGINMDRPGAVLQTESGQLFYYRFSGSIREAYIGEDDPAGTYTANFTGDSLVIEQFEEGTIGRLYPLENNPPAQTLSFRKTISVYVRGEQPTDRDTGETEKSGDSETDDKPKPDGERREPADAPSKKGASDEQGPSQEVDPKEPADGEKKVDGIDEKGSTSGDKAKQEGLIQSEFLRQIRRILSQMDVLTNVLAFFAGMVMGASSEIEASKLGTLTKKYFKAITYWQFRYFDEYLAGLGEGIFDELKGIYDIIKNPKKFLDTVLKLGKFVIYEAEPPMMRTAGKQVGSRFGKQIEDLIGSSGGTFMKKLGAILGPLLLELVVSLVTSGVGAVVKGSKFLARLIKKFPDLGTLKKLIKKRGKFRRQITSDGDAPSKGGGKRGSSTSGELEGSSSKAPEGTRSGRDSSDGDRDGRDDAEQRAKAQVGSPHHVKFDASVREELIRYWRNYDVENDSDLDQSDVDGFIDNIQNQDTTTGKQAEREMAHFYGKTGKGKEQQSFKSGREAEHGEEGSTRPDVTNQNVLVEVKQRSGSSLTEDFLIEKTIRELRQQIGDRAVEGPAGINQTIVMDVRGTKFGGQGQKKLAEKIVAQVNKELGSRGPQNLPKITVKDIQFVTW